MPDKLFAALALRAMPTFVTQPSELRLLRRLRGAGYLDVRFFPEENSADQFAELHGMTPLGRRVLDIVRHSGAQRP
ncbi:hypothetical protein [Variovorax sp. UMC13]|uniref:hypothetical protein n=1 Tax=Variovorax sp. UMC13 TaxID=1862326 RepID=UPI001600EBA5|nr:hypothetical protein [Variovorax sp. UMC13]